MMEKTCCFTGHKNLTQEQAIEALHLLIKRVNELTIEGYTHFISSFANDTDVLLAQIIGSFRYKNKDLILEKQLFRLRISLILWIKLNMH